ncbi:MAG: hypothetical protein GC192_15915 [Bacteroidetes bacterium]|nr:hypothetical protein [Bacteroidota bacterium]
MSPQRINTIAELQAEQDRLQDQMRVTRKMFFESASHTTATGKDFLLKNVLLPVGAIGLGAFVAKKISDHADASMELPAEVHAAIAPEQNNSSWFSKLMLVALPFVQQFFLREKTEEQATQPTEDERSYSSGIAENNTTNWLSTLIPIVIPLAQQFFLKRAEQANEQPMAVEVEGDGMVEGTFTKKEGASAIFESLYKLLPVVLPLVQQYFAEKNNAKEAQQSKAAFARNGQYAEAVA